MCDHIHTRHETWDKCDDGFRVMLDNVNDTLRKLGAEPPTEDTKDDKTA